MTQTASPSSTPPTTSVVPSRVGSPVAMSDTPKHLAARDHRLMLELMVELACRRHDPLAWRTQLLNTLMRHLTAAAACTFVVPPTPGPKHLKIEHMLCVGFDAPQHQQAFLQEFSQAPFQDPFLQQFLAPWRYDLQPVFTATRCALVDDDRWYSSPHLRLYRLPANVDDCLVSSYRWTVAPDAAQLMIVCAFRRRGDRARFGERERVFLDTLHRALEWMYHLEQATGRLASISTLAPRLYQTLELLVSGQTEKLAAKTMDISKHTVHEYAKALYAHFSVSSRGELVLKWLQPESLSTALPAVSWQSVTSGKSRQRHSTSPNLPLEGDSLANK